jgi:chromosome transmission fidelity protein 1
LLSLSTHKLPLHVLVTSLSQVGMYVRRFKTRLSPANLLQLKKLVVFLEALKKYTLEWKVAQTTSAGKSPSERAEVMTIADLMQRMDKRASGINLLEVETYLKKSKVRVFHELSFPR